jgi:hypothetical protein
MATDPPLADADVVRIHAPSEGPEQIMVNITTVGASGDALHVQMQIETPEASRVMDLLTRTGPVRVRAAWGGDAGELTGALAMRLSRILLAGA